MAVPGGGVASASSWNDLMVLLGVMGMQLALVHISAAEPLPHLSFKNTPIKGMSKCVHRDCLDHWRAIKVISVLAYLFLLYMRYTKGLELDDAIHTAILTQKDMKGKSLPTTLKLG
ncbi:hypothetical protein GUJ93_ZPchr0012g19565 [Zizania palustris]|uniref:Uncharacterized protein n=1 Tax=Zizania palustris TaxID=103762 RepID=A0A8J5WV53_ZIZPA|nr:hypothetical protein GUJ93_ZPchr0012g19565 [Zizania palustris]